MKYISFLICLLLFAFATNAANSGLEIGDPAPDFTLTYATKEGIFWDGVTLSNLVGENYIVLAFYPANWSRGCTRQLCAYRDDFSEFEKLNAIILGISGDYVYAHHEWAKQENYPFMLLSDHKHEVGKLYDSYHEESGYNRRTVFVIDKEGKIAYKNMRYSVADATDFQSLLEALEQLYSR